MICLGFAFASSGQWQCEEGDDRADGQVGAYGTDGGESGHSCGGDAYRCSKEDRGGKGGAQTGDEKEKRGEEEEKETEGE